MKKVFLITFLILFLFLVFNRVQAAGLVPCGEKGNPCQLCHIFVMFNNIINFLIVPTSDNAYFPPVLIIAVLMLVVGGVMYMFAYFSGAELLPGGVKGGPKMLGQAKKLITSVVLGLFIIYGAWLIINLFFDAIGVMSWTRLGEWWKIECPIIQP